jgi:hypothetical protein
MNYNRGDVISIVYRPPTKGLQRMTKSRPMVVISNSVYHIEQNQIGGKIGSLSTQDMQGVENSLKRALGL